MKGFGTNAANAVRTVLNHVELAFVPVNVCAFDWASNAGGIPPVLFDPSMMCAWDLNQAACTGDEGGPLYDGTAKVLVGITNKVPNVAGACTPNATNGGAPVETIYSKVAQRFGWIKDTVCNDHSSPKPAFCPQAAPTIQPVAKPASKPAPKPKGK